MFEKPGDPCKKKRGGRRVSQPTRVNLNHSRRPDEQTLEGEERKSKKKKQTEEGKKEGGAGKS